MFAEKLRRVRPEIAAIPLIVVVIFAFRAKSLTVGVGGDEFSLLAMAGVILEGGFPYAEFWDVRPLLPTSGACLPPTCRTPLRLSRR